MRRLWGIELRGICYAGDYGRREDTKGDIQQCKQEVY